jgi:hypothetical protein
VLTPRVIHESSVPCTSTRSLHPYPQVRQEQHEHLKERFPALYAPAEHTARGTVVDEEELEEEFLTGERGPGSESDFTAATSVTATAASPLPRGIAGIRRYYALQQQADAQSEGQTNGSAATAPSRAVSSAAAATAGAASPLNAPTGGRQLK